MSKLPARSRQNSAGPSASSGFGERLAATREKREMTRKDLALAAKISESALCRLETNPGGSTEAGTIFKLATALSVRPEWLWQGVEPRDLAPAERRIAELRKKLESADAEDPELEQALKKSVKRQHLAVVAVANTFARNGERHTVDGWLARLDEIAASLAAILPR